LYDIYTKDADEAVAAGVYAAGVYRLASMYEDFMSAMYDRIGTDITSFKAFPYDWRLRLDQQLQTIKNAAGEVRYDSSVGYQDGLLYQTIEALPDDVTIVAHSNGGLVAKALMAKLQAENDPLLAKIKNLVLVGVPQVGTPEAVVGVLHGSPISGGTVVTQETSRALLNNAPFGYHLLPNESYFNGDGSAVETPVIVFDAGTSTDAWRATYGEAIDSYTEMRAFMGSASGRSAAAIDDLYTPQIANDTLLDYGESIEDVLSAWTPSTSTRVYQLTGTGMWTPKTLRYFTGEKCVSYVPEMGRCLAYGPQLLHETYFTQAGDGTVVLPSAAAMRERENVERWWLNLVRFNNDNESELVHRDMLEHPEVPTFIRDIIVGSSTTPYSYIGRTLPTLPTEHQLVYRLHSPLDMYVTSNVGVVSSTTNTIRGAQYRRVGETQYVILPATISDAVLHLVGQSSGSFTLVAEGWRGEERTVLHDYQAIPTATSTVVTLDLLATTTLSIDFDGDGTFEGIVAAERDVIDAASVTPTTTSLPVIANTQGSRPKSKTIPVPQVAGASTDDELIRIERMVQLLQQIIQLYIQLKNI
jgi:pimeloyl-ACP methyl ester carboxylesterase